MNETAIVRIFVGIILLFLGRKLFWFFVGAAGFMAGLIYVPQFFQGQPGWLLLILAVVAGILGAILALILQRFAVALAGFFVGGYLLTALVGALQINAGQFDWVVFVIGGLAGAVLVSFLFDWALIFLSSLTGATLVAQSLPVSPLVAGVVFVILLVAGVVIQTGIQQREAVVPAAPMDEGPQ